MKTIKLFIVALISCCFIQACDNGSEVATAPQDPNAIDTITTGCLGSYDINPSDNKEKDQPGVWKRSY